MIIGTGEMLNFFAMASATGAIMSTVATLSTNADTMPAKRLRAMIVARTVLTLSSSTSAMSDGMPVSMKIDTRPIVPAIIISTFQSIAPGTAPGFKMPRITNSAAEIKATQCRLSGSASSRIYVSANRISAIVI